MGTSSASDVFRRPQQSRRIIIACIIILVCFLNFGFLSSYLSPSHQSTLAVHYVDKFNDGLRKCAKFRSQPVEYDALEARKQNLRWNHKTGQNHSIVLHNVTLFDGEAWLLNPVNIAFDKGLITSIKPVAEGLDSFGDAQIVDGEGRHVTPGLVDMHSHHLVGTWPGLYATEDTNEVNDKSLTSATGPLTPFVRSLDGIKPYDVATDIIRSGGVTSSLILPGSANIMGGEAYVVKNILRAGSESEENVEELLLEYGVDMGERRRYMKMACGENPKRVYRHTRMGNAWIFRKHLEHAQKLRNGQDTWCMAAEEARDRNDVHAIGSLARSGLPEQLEYESTVGMLRGQVDLHNHCYEPEDFQAMLRHSEEFGFNIRAFHHALSAWKVPEMIKASGHNITIATFSDFGFYKQEGYEANLYAGKILEEHDVPVAYKSDHGEEATNAKYLLFEAQNAHRFGMSAEGALRAVTSVPARSLRLDHRIGHVKTGFDADLVVWSSHPLAVGATPLQVYVDGRATLDETMSRKSLAALLITPAQVQLSRQGQLPNLGSKEFCRNAANDQSILITGIRRSFVEAGHFSHEIEGQNSSLLFVNGQVSCFGPEHKCVAESDQVRRLRLQNGHILPGLTSVSTGLGLEEIPAESSTTDSRVPADLDVMNPSNLVYAKYAIHLEGKAFKRAQIGGVTRAVSIPHVDEGGFGGAVSVGIKTTEHNTLLDGGVFQDEVGLHFVVGQAAKKSTGTVSKSVANLLKILTDNVDKANIYGKAVKGEFPLVVHTENKYDILQLIAIKHDFNALNMVIFGGAEAPLVAPELATANVSLIFTRHRGAPDSWEKKDMMTGPPLTSSPVTILHSAGVRFALAIESAEGNSFIHNLPIEASWAGKYAGLSEREAIKLVSTNVEEILGLQISNDIVIWEGNPLEFGAMPALMLDQDTKRITKCLPTGT